MPPTSPQFIYLFLPCMAAVWWRLQVGGKHCAAQWAVVAGSLVFYGCWDIRHIPLLVASACLNYVLGCRLGERRSPPMLAVGIAANLGLLGTFKYADFAIGNASAAFGWDIAPPGLALPLGVSFFTFQAISYLVDSNKGLCAGLGFRRFFFSAIFFPHLVAGPILRWSDMAYQLDGRTRFCGKGFSQGLYLFGAGLAKKAVVADRIAGWVEPLYAAPEQLDFVAAWAAAAGYGLQVYFDFSGYSDMALGVALLFGIALPQNFNSPYQSQNIAIFWTRWHITLSQFLKDYIYIPMGGNRHGFSRGIFSAAFTLLMGGFWHGAAWTFVLWGALHGAYVAAHRVWVRAGGQLPKPLGIGLTYLCVTVAWVLFRSQSFNQALSIWQGMVGLNGFLPPTAFSTLCTGCGTSGLVSGLEVMVCVALLWFCMASSNSNSHALTLEPSAKALFKISLLFFTGLWFPGTHESFIYWQF